MYFVNIDNQVTPIVYHVAEEVNDLDLKKYIINQVQEQKLNDQDIESNAQNTTNVSFTHGFNYGTEWRVCRDWIRNDYVYYGRAAWLRGKYNLFSVSEFIAFVCTTSGGKTYYAQMTELSISPDLQSYGFGLDRLTYEVTLSHNNTLPVKLWDYAPKSKPAQRTETYSVGVSSNSEGVVSANVGSAYSTVVSDIQFTDKSVVSQELMKLVIEVVEDSNYGKNTTTFTFLTIVQDTNNQSSIWITRKLDTLFYADPTFYWIDWTTLYISSEISKR